MVRGTTAIFTILITDSTVALTELSALAVTFSQNGHTVIERSLNEVTIDTSNKTITIAFTQKETLRFKDGKVELQVALKYTTGQVIRSEIMTTTAERILKDGEI